MPFGTQQQEEFEQKHNVEMEIATRELKRRSMDTIRVYNPLDTQFSFMYDRYWHRVPAKTEKDFDRYLAMHFFKKICDYMIGQQILAKGEELKAIREKQMGKQYLDKYEENTEVWDRVPTMNDPDLINEIRKIVIVGLVEEYGEDMPEEDLREPEAKIDFRPLHEQAFENIGRVPTTPVDTVKPLDTSDTPPLEEILGSDRPAPEKTTSKSKLLKEVTNDK